MPSLETFDLDSKALLWEWQANDRDTRYQVGAAEEIDVRWVPTNARAQDPQGNTITIDVQMAADRLIPMGSILHEGADNGTTPTADFMEVKTVKAAKDVKGRATRYEYGLMRYGDTLPEVV